MALSGPHNFREAVKLLEKAEREKNAGEQALLLDRAKTHALLALVAATVYGGNMSAADIQLWEDSGLRRKH